MHVWILMHPLNYYYCRNLKISGWKSLRITAAAAFYNLLLKRESTKAWKLRSLARDHKIYQLTKSNFKHEVSAKFSEVLIRMILWQPWDKFCFLCNQGFFQWQILRTLVSLILVLATCCAIKYSIVDSKSISKRLTFQCLFLGTFISTRLAMMNPLPQKRWVTLTWPCWTRCRR